MTSPKPITLSAGANPTPGVDPQPFVLTNAGDAVANVSTADGSDAATTQALANALKAKVNALLAELRQAGVIAP